MKKVHTKRAKGSLLNQMYWRSLAEVGVGVGSTAVPAASLSLSRNGTVGASQGGSEDVPNLDRFTSRVLSLSGVGSAAAAVAAAVAVAVAADAAVAAAAGLPT